MRPILLAAMLCAGIPLAPAWAETTAIITDWGETTGDLGEQLPPDANGVMPPRTLANMRYLTHSDQIVARLCASFDISVRLVPDDGDDLPDQLELVAHHPLITTPDGHASTVDRFFVPMHGDATYGGFGFDNAWELQPGQWIFEVVLDGKVLASKTFTVTLPQPGESRSVCQEEPTS